MGHVFITGGAGFIGRALIKRYYKDYDITIFSRDESKHYLLKKKYPKLKCIIGDVRDYNHMLRSSRGVSTGIFAASLKQIEAVDQNCEQAIRTIIIGALNSRRVAEENHFVNACFISSDKSRAATTLYGSMKFVAGELFIVNANAKEGPLLSTAIYGNVMNSTGSIIPVIWDYIKRKAELTLYSTEMTRFMITSEKAVDLINKAVQVSGFNVIPKLKSFRVQDLFDIYEEEFGLAYAIGDPRVSEKTHEIMIAEEELPRVHGIEDIYYMHYKTVYNSISLPNNRLSSADCLISKEHLYEHLAASNFYESAQ